MMTFLEARKDLLSLHDSLVSLRERMIEHRSKAGEILSRIGPENQDAALNFLDYVFLRQNDLRPLQVGLAQFGLSSLGRLEHDVEPHLSQVIRVIQRLTSEQPNEHDIGPYCGQGRAQVRASSLRLFGTSDHEGPHFMVTIPRKEMFDIPACRVLVRNGLQIARYNCSKMSESDLVLAASIMREAARLEGRSVKLSFELGGPKIRVQRIRIKHGVPHVTVGVPAGEARLSAPQDQTRAPQDQQLSEIPSTSKKSRKKSLKKWAIRSGDRIVVHWPKVCGHVGPGDRFLFDDGQLELIATKVNRTYEDPRPFVKVLTQVSDIHAPEHIIKLGQGCTSPLHQSQLATLTPKDLADLDAILPWADLVGVSFVRRAEDVRDLRERLRKKGRLDVGIIIKIETQEAIADLTRILLEVLTLPRAAIMIARGDLALQLGFSRLLDLQQELLWFTAAARLPVIWATQVLEHLATTGLPTRAEVSDVTQAAEADCIMINCGPYLVGTLHFLRHAVAAAAAHKDKRFSMLRRLRVADSPLN